MKEAERALDGHRIAGLAQGVGLECAALDVERARAALGAWRARAEGRPHVREAEEIEGELAGIRTLILLALPYRTYQGYPEGVGQVSGYYPASHRAYLAAGELAEALEREGIRARRGRRLPLKPLARAAGLGDYGRNGVIVRRGSHIALQLLLLERDVEAMPPARCEPMPCDSCGACVRACPTGALSAQGVDAARCLRSYMEGKEAPPDIAPHMGERLLGCDECLNACPGMRREAMPEGWEELFAWETLLDGERFARAREAMAEIVGVNAARTMRRAALRWKERRERGGQGGS